MGLAIMRQRQREVDSVGCNNARKTERGRERAIQVEWYCGDQSSGHKGGEVA